MTVLCLFAILSLVVSPFFSCPLSLLGYPRHLQQLNGHDARLPCLFYFIFFISHNHLNQRGSLRSINTATLFLVNDHKKAHLVNSHTHAPPEEDRLINPCTARCSFEQPFILPPRLPHPSPRPNE